MEKKKKKAFKMDLGVSIHSILHLEVSQMTHKAKEPLYNVQKEYAM